MSNPNTTISILIVDDHRLFRDGLRKNLEEDAGIRIAAEAGTGREAIILTGKHSPDIITMDINLPDMSGIEVVRRIRKIRPATRIIGLSMYSDRPLVLSMIKAGATGFLTKTCSAAELSDAVYAVAAGKNYICTDVMDDVIRSALDPDETDEPSMEAKLTKREQQILKFISDGKTSTHIAETLGISVRTVEKHRKNIMDKLDIRTVAQLTKYAIRQGLTQLE